MSLLVRRYKERDAEAWDESVAKSYNGTFLHERRFLAYHGDRFDDLSLLVEDDRGRIAGTFAAALHPTREDCVVSHPGATYGGLVHGGALRGGMTLEALGDIAGTYRAMGLRWLRYRAVPYIYHNVPSADDLYALFRLGAVRYRCDLSVTIDLSSPRKPSKGRRTDLNKARRAGVQIALGSRYLEPFWVVLEKNLAAKYGARPVHTLEEIMRLQSMFPEQIKCVVGILDDEVVAGSILFHSSPQVVHSQYRASNSAADGVGAMTMVDSHAIEKSKTWGARYFDFGTTNEDEGRTLNEGLYKFKTSFGAGSVAYEFYELNLDEACIR